MRNTGLVSNARAARTPRVATPSDRDRDFVASLQKGLDVLTRFSREANRLTISQAAQLCGVSPGSARRSLHTLHALGYLDSDGKRFWTAEKCLLIARAYLTSRPIPSVAQPLLDALSERTRESASLGKPLDDDVIIIARSTARRSLSTGLGIGSRLPAYCSSLGRVLLASLPSDEAELRIRAMPRPRLTPKTIHDADAVLSLVERCRKQGFASSDEELEMGVCSMAVPVFNHDGLTVAAMSIAVRAERMRPTEFQEEFLPALRRARDTLSNSLRGTERPHMT
jgi:IclR family pca regulon transcriptional regulator